MSQFIIKLQRPLAASVSDPPLLIYNETRTIFTTVPSNRALLELLGSAAKVYAWAELVNGGRLHITGPAPTQPW